MKWASAIAQGVELNASLEQCAKAVAAELNPSSPASFAVVFASASYSDALHQVPLLLGAHFPDAVILGCSAEGVIGNGVEIEREPAVALTAGHLPGVHITPFHATSESLPTPDDPPEAWARLLGIHAEDQPHFLILMDPYSAGVADLLAGLDFAFPAAVKVGGLASGGRTPGSHTLYLGRDTYHDGAVGIALTGDVTVDTVVAQGCRPIGDPKRVTQCQRNILLEMDSEPPLTYLQRLYQALTPRDQALIRGNLFLGIAIDPLLTPEGVRPGDFLIRNLIGADQERGILAIGEHLREGMLVQFHVRDAMTSSEDLQRQLLHYLESKGGDAPEGALLFQCNGRGVHLYGKPNHDADLFKKCVGSIPLGGFFCNGEIGPVGGTTYLHGYTSSFAIFRKP